MKILIYLTALITYTLSWAQTNSDLYKPNNSDISNNNPSLVGSDGKKQQTYSITIAVTNIRSRDGVIRFKFFDDTKPFPHDRGFLRIVVPKTHMVGDSLTVTYSGFTSQNMGIALLDDENDNWELDFGWFLPKEGHAFSNYYHTALRRPVYNDFRFLLKDDKRVVMKMKYY